VKTIAFFNNKGGVGKTSLVYHVAWMFGEMGMKVLAADLDPQANLSSMFLEEDRLEELWPDGDHPNSILGAIKPILRGMGDVECPHVEEVADNVGLVVGDLGLSTFEDRLSESWPKCHNRDEAAFRTMSAFHRGLRLAAERQHAEVVLIDVGPNLGAINRSAIIASEHVVIPLAPDLFSVQGLRNLGPALREWRKSWQEMSAKNPNPMLPLPRGRMQPVGYVTLQPVMRLDRPVKAYGRWMSRIPATYREAVLDEDPGQTAAFDNDPHAIASLKHRQSLMPMAMEARKPMFFLKPADGAVGAHANAVNDCYWDFRRLATKIAERCGIPVPTPV